MTILKALHDLYGDLAAQGRVPLPGYSMERIAFAVDLREDGSVANVISLAEGSSDGEAPKREAPAARIQVPAAKKRPGTQPPAHFLWDKSGYAFGVSRGTVDLEALVASNQAEGRDTPEAVALADKLDAERAKDAWRFGSFRDTVVNGIPEAVADRGLAALRRFVLTWDPTHFFELPNASRMLDQNVAFKLLGKRRFVHDSQEAQRLVSAKTRPSGAAQRTCLVTGELDTVARLHPAIKNVEGAQSSGADLVSFNQGSSTSFGKVQGENSPIGEATASRYVTALNHLLASDSNKVRIGDTTVVFWAAAEEAVVADDLAALFSAPLWSSRATEEGRIGHALSQLANGIPAEEIGGAGGAVPFRILGLAPNASRLSVRFWLDTTVGNIFSKLGQHYADLAISPPAWRRPPTLRDLVTELAPYRSTKAGPKPDVKAIPSQLSGELARAVMTGQRYPASILPLLLSRFRADHRVSGPRIALIRAVLKRSGERIPMAIDVDSTDVPYRLGRLFAAIEKAQADAVKNTSSTVTDKFIATASASPSRVFPLLLRGAKTHVGKLRKTNGAIGFHLERMIGEIVEGLPADTPFPAHLTAAEQGRFFVGYYHQKNGVIYAKRVPEDLGSDPAPAVDHETESKD